MMEVYTTGSSETYNDVSVNGMEAQDFHQSSSTMGGAACHAHDTSVQSREKVKDPTNTQWARVVHVCASSVS